MGNDMKLCRALGIVNNIESEEISDREKAAAIYVLCIRAARIDEVHKKELLGIIRWLWKRLFRVREKGKPSS